MSEERDKKLAREAGVDVRVVRAARELDKSAKQLATVVLQMVHEISHEAHDNDKKAVACALMTLKLAAAVYERELKEVEGLDTSDVIEVANGWVVTAVEDMFRTVREAEKRRRN